ncbi:MAG: PAS domain-containing sensor histidine kinase [Candidatus Geothermincolia bacterium]
MRERRMFKNAGKGNFSLENSQAIVVHLDLEGIITYANDFALDYFGYTEKELIGSPRIGSIVPERDSSGADLREVQRELLESGARRHPVRDGEHRRADGSTCWVHWVNLPLVDDSGEVTGILGIGTDITASKRASLRLKSLEASYDTLLDAANSVICVWDALGKITFMNRYGLEFFGYGRSELEGRSILGTIVPVTEESGRDLSGLIEDILENPDAFVSYENENVRADGSRVWMVWGNRVVLDPAGRVQEVISIGNDITLRKTALEALERSEAFYRSLFETSIDAIIVADIEGNLLDVNPAAVALSGFSREEWLTQTAAGAQGGAWLEFRSMQYEKLAEKGSASFQIRFNHKNGGEKLFEVHGSLAEFKGEAAVFWVAHDQTESMQAEEELRRSEEYYRMIFNRTSDAIFVTDRAEHILDVNPAAVRMYGYTREEFLALHPSRLSTPETRETRRDRLNAIWKETGLQIATPQRRKDGSEFFVEYEATHVTHEGREALLSVVHDVTERELHERELTERSRQLSEFLSIAAHELGIPVTIMKGYAQTLERHIGKLSPEIVQNIVNSIDSSADRLEQLVQELLDVSRIESGRFPFSMRPVRLKELAHDAVRQIQMRVTGHVFQTNVDGELECAADPARCVQALLVLLDNATRYAPRGSMVEVHAEPEGEMAMVSVHDRGVGVPYEDRERIFEPFFRGEQHDHHSTTGLGLGLFVASEIVEGHGGRIGHEPRDGGGSVFRFSLPLASPSNLAGLDPHGVAETLKAH